MADFLKQKIQERRHKRAVTFEQADLKKLANIAALHQIDNRIHPNNDDLFSNVQVRL
jgi:hypothetical protein